MVQGFIVGKLMRTRLRMLYGLTMIVSELTEMGSFYGSIDESKYGLYIGKYGGDQMIRDLEGIFKD